jgi:prepilin-type N-terminal cleavage/methylation domain-containing protein
MKRTGQKSGFTLVEILIVVLIIATMMGAFYLILSTGQATWFTTDVKIQVQENLRKTISRISMELRQTESSRLQIADGAGFNNTDVIKFSVPVICEAGGILIDSNGDVAHWGAPLTWGCTSEICMDQDQDCSALEYKYVEYRINNQNELVRRVLDESDNLVAENKFATHVSDFQVSLNSGIATLDVATTATSLIKRDSSEAISIDIYLRN